MDYVPPPQRESPGAGRDAGLWRLSRLRRALAVGSVALVGAVSAFVAQAKPGKSTGSATTPTADPTGAGGSSSSGANFAQTPLRASSSTSAEPSESPSPTVAPPTQAPVQPAAPAAPPVVSGGS